jgi:hypothetical protein
MEKPSIAYGTFELLYELPMSAVSGGVGLGAGVGRGREPFVAPFAVTAPIARMKTADAVLINFVGIFICLLCPSFSEFAGSYGRG